MTRTAYEQAIDRFTADPTSGQVSPLINAQLVNGRARVSAGPFNFDADLSPVVGGGNQAPSPSAYLLGALAACAVAFINDALAPEFGVVVDDLTARAQCGTDLAGLVGFEGADPRLRDITIAISLTSASPIERVAALEQAWIERCPIYLALVEPMAVEVTFAPSSREEA